MKRHDQGSTLGRAGTEIPCNAHYKEFSMSNISTIAATPANPEVELGRLEQFAWLIDNAGDDRNIWRLKALWGWAGDMAHFQSVANTTGKPVEYIQRGETLRVLYPQKTQEAA
jgi:hypothetical protein